MVWGGGSPLPSKNKVKNNYVVTNKCLTNVNIMTYQHRHVTIINTIIHTVESQS